MFARKLLSFAVLFFTLCVTGYWSYAQDPSDAEARVPELEAFHEVIYQIWHKAYPEKNTAMLGQLLPDVEEGIDRVASAKLPGILREKKAAWDKGVQELQSAGENYKAAVSAKDEAKMLAAAETLHSRFEMLMRTIRPALRELEDFHSVLYMLYHHYLPQYDLERIRPSVAELKQKMKALDEVQVPANVKDRAAAFQAARAKLSASVDALQSSLSSNDEKTIRGAVETMHSNYQALSRIFE